MKLRNLASLKVYKETESIRKTARELHIFHGTVRRVIIEAGLYISKRIQDIQQLRESGMTVNQIAKERNVSRSTVWNYLLYKCGYQLDGHKSVNALRIQACRERKKARQLSTNPATNPEVTPI